MAFPTLLLALAGTAQADTIAIPRTRIEAMANLDREEADCVDDRPCSTFALTPSIPVTFSKLDFNPDGSKTIGRDIALGGGATFMFARGRYHVDTQLGEYTIEDAVPTFFFGLAGQAGMTETQAGEVAYSVTGSGFVGTRFFALMGGFDFINDTPFIGVAANVTGTSLSSKAAIVFGSWR